MLKIDIAKVSRIHARGSERVVRPIRDEYNKARASHKQSKRRLRALRSFKVSHYTLLALSTFDVLLAIFAMANTNAPWRPVMLVISGACFFVGMWILLSNVEK